MAIDFSTHPDFAGKINPSTPDYPLGSATNTSGPGAGTGTPWRARLINELWGFQQALLAEANITPNGLVDTGASSQYYEAIEAIINASTPPPSPNKIRNIRTINVAGSFTSNSTDDVVLVTAASGTINYTLQTAQTLPGRVLSLKKTINTTAATIVIGTQNTQTINGLNTISINAALGTITLRSDGTNWFAKGDIV